MLLTLLAPTRAQQSITNQIGNSGVYRCVEIMFDDITWTDVTGYVFDDGGVDWHVGRSNRLDKFQAGGCTVTFDNSDRRFDPEHTASPYYPNIKPGKQIRIRTQSTISGVLTDNYMFTGKIDDWPQEYDQPSKGICAAVATDAFGDLAKINLGDSPLYTMIQQDQPTGWWQLNET